MRIVHTSDWHLGRRFGPMSLRADQEAFADWFVGLCRDQSADLVVIAGDLYDRAIAPVEAIELFRDTVRRLLALGPAVAAITGNHDGPDRVAPHGDLLDGSRFYLRGGYDGVGRVIGLDAADGPLDLVLLPFLDPQAAPDAFGLADEGTGDEDPAAVAAAADPEPSTAGEADTLVARRRRRTHESVLDAACRTAAGQLRAPRSIAVAHAFVTGSQPSDSERDLVVGGTGDVPSTLFAPFSYTALGHLHRPQSVVGVNARYSGTPLAYSFSEEHGKSVLVVDMDPFGGTAITTVPVDVGRRVRTLTGTIEELLDPDCHPDARDCFVRAVLTDRETVLDAKARLAEVYPAVVEVRLRPPDRDRSVGEAGPDVRELAPIEVTRLFWEAAEGSAPDPDTDAVLVTAASRAGVEDPA